MTNRPAMLRRPTALLAFAVFAGAPVPSSLAQDASLSIRDEMMRQFGASAGKLTQLSAAMPDETFSWSPGDGVMSVARVYAHIARYNFMYLRDNLDVPAPESVDLEAMEDMTDPDAVREILGRSIEHVRTHVAEMTSERLGAETTLYGRRVPGWAVLVQLVSHMNEHVGQSIAYARMNGVVPPWSRGSN